MEPVEVLKHYAVELLALPVHQSAFTALLKKKNLLPGNTLSRINAMSSEADAAQLLVNNIERTLSISRDGFDNLISVMKQYKISGIEGLANQMEEAASGRKRRKEHSESDTDVPAKQISLDSTDTNDEKVHNRNDGAVYYPDNVRDEKSKAICLIKTPKGAGTGVIGRIKIEDEDSTVLLTNYHVIIDGLLPEEQYKDAIANKINPEMKKKIEENAKCCEISLLGKDIKLSEGILIENSSIWSPVTSLDYFIMKLNEKKLKKKLNADIPTIDFNDPEEVKCPILVTIFQYPEAGSLSYAPGICKIVEDKTNRARAPLLVYRAGTNPGSSGGLLLKAIDKPDLVPVGLHRGGHKETKDVRGYNYGSSFFEIIKSIKDNDWHPPVLDRKNESDKKAIDDVVNTIEP